MATYTLVETTNWVASNLREEKVVSSVEILSDQVLHVSRDKLDPFVAGIVSATRVEVNTIRALVEHDLDVEFIANVPKESFWTGEAILLAQRNCIATGAYGDLLRVLSLRNVRGFQSKETEFIERCLRQHDKVASFYRVHDRLYRISRNGLPDIVVVMINEYELTADHVRTARDRYGQFSVAVITNPNGGSTSSADVVAATMGCEILKWGPFLGRINSK